MLNVPDLIDMSSLTLVIMLSIVLILLTIRFFLKLLYEMFLHKNDSKISHMQCHIIKKPISDITKTDIMEKCPTPLCDCSLCPHCTSRDKEIYTEKNNY